MRYMQVTDNEWHDFSNQVERGEACAGIVLVEGSSEIVAQQVQSLLEHASFRGEAYQYYLSSGSEQFRVPCYVSLAEGETASEPLHPSHLLQEQSTIKDQPSLAVSRLVQNLANGSSMPHFVIIEYMTPPGQHDLLFTSHLLHSPLVQRIPILIFVHQRSHSDRHLPCENAVIEMLSLLYVCGGRIRVVDWARLIDGPVDHDAATRLFSSRCIASETWVCYAHRGIAEMAENIYRTRDQGKIIKHTLYALPNNIGYPLLAIAAETDEIELMQSKYSFKEVNIALTEPQSVVRYFTSLHRLAQQAGNESLVGVAYICYLAAFIYVDRLMALQIYQKVQESSLAPIEQKSEAAFWGFLGQKLAVMSVPEAWTYAAECLYRSRAIIDNLYDTEKIKRIEWRFLLASIAKVEGLIAYKLGDGERTRQAMEFAINELEKIVSSLPYLVDARVNFGDAFLRLLGDAESAILQYEAALEALLRVSTELKKRIRLSNRSELRPAQKLGDALVLVGRYEEAIQLFEILLSRIETVSVTDGKEHAQQRLKARLALAETYLKLKRPRSAAACYWLILRRSDWLDLTELKETAAKLRTQRSGLHQRLDRRIDTIINTQEKIMLDATTTQRVLASL